MSARLRSLAFACSALLGCSTDEHAQTTSNDAGNVDGSVAGGRAGNGGTDTGGRTSSGGTTSPGGKMGAGGRTSAGGEPSAGGTTNAGGMVGAGGMANDGGVTGPAPTYPLKRGPTGARYLVGHGATVMAYLPSSRAVTIDVAKVAGTMADAWWYDPARGTAAKIGTYPTSGTTQFTPPAAGDWVLVVDAADMSFAPPGTVR